MALTTPSCDLDGLFVGGASSSIETTRVRHAARWYRVQETRLRSASFLSNPRSPPC
jgi:hypothetical protein